MRDYEYCATIWNIFRYLMAIHFLKTFCVYRHLYFSVSTVTSNNL